MAAACSSQREVGGLFQFCCASNANWEGIHLNAEERQARQVPRQEGVQSTQESPQAACTSNGRTCAESEVPAFPVQPGLEGAKCGVSAGDKVCALYCVRYAPCSCLRALDDRPTVAGLSFPILMFPIAPPFCTTAASTRAISSPSIFTSVDKDFVSNLLTPYPYVLETLLLDIPCLASPRPPHVAVQSPGIYDPQPKVPQRPAGEENLGANVSKPAKLHLPLASPPFRIPAIQLAGGSRFSNQNSARVLHKHYPVTYSLSQALPVLIREATWLAKSILRFEAQDSGPQTRGRGIKADV
ncbi:uncharacterized protein CLUP02_16368 [Colletotrichum lupini]|uniref:Uncharacterized protein n=1 Tax=Colletotrichum lupini TaxID=145971 RepID=A0A9Q8T9Z5_9PEZI|nr:uncharacterized protein CLUP02_16368 [Colletotrichum lupini]UQC90836.1 hypothetical protein CLUP02_16368 [Colletotrichum lupini]